MEINVHATTSGALLNYVGLRG